MDTFRRQEPANMDLRVNVITSKERITQSTANTLGLLDHPLRPGWAICSHYNLYGLCWYGPTRKFEYHIQPIPFIYTTYPLYPPPYSSSCPFLSLHYHLYPLKTLFLQYGMHPVSHSLPNSFHFPFSLDTCMTIPRCFTSRTFSFQSICHANPFS